MRKLAEAIIAPESTVELVLGTRTRFWSRALLYLQLRDRNSTLWSLVHPISHLRVD
jgi:hypothetical protein